VDHPAGPSYQEYDRMKDFGDDDDLVVVVAAAASAAAALSPSYSQGRCRRLLTSLSGL
jgi:hypothetical protein